MNEKTLGLVGGGVAGLALGSALGYLAGRRSRKKAKKSRRNYNRRNSRKRNYSKKKRQRQPYTAGRRKDTSRRRIRYTKNNQPYVIMANGRARFIKKSSVRNSRKRIGGKY